VAGFDLTFSVPKSVSVLWGLADPGTQAWIVEAHHAAVAEAAFTEDGSPPSPRTTGRRPRAGRACRRRRD
jgi:hypothetical protein